MKPYKEKKMIRSYFERIKAKALVGKTSKYTYTVYGHNGVAYQLSDGKLYLVRQELINIYGDSQDKAYECFDGYYYEVKGE